MASIKLQGSTSGEITISAPAVAGTNTLTLPANTGNIVTTGDSATVTQGMIGSGVAGTGPAFSAYANAGQTLTSGVATKLLYGVEEFDTNSNFASSTFTPTVAGYYQINAQVQPNNTYTGSWIAVYKNGSVFKYGNFFLSAADGGSVVSALVYCNGTTDYIDIYAQFVSGQAVSSGPAFVYFQGFLARAA